MVGNHVTQRSRLIVVTSAFLHSDGFSHRNLYVVDISPVPNRFENSVSETKSQDILNRLLSEIVIDPVNLLLFSNVQELFIQSSCRLQIVTKWLLNDYSPPVLIVLRQQPHFAQALYDGAKKFRCGRQVKKVITMRGVIFVYLLQCIFQLRIYSFVPKISRYVMHAANEPFP